MHSESFQLDEFYLDIQGDGHNINPISEEEMRNVPYPGLRPYRTCEYPIFFGRDGQADKLIGKLRRKRFLAVLGSSGTGKSSLVRAGMLAQLHGGYVYDAGFTWDIAICRPGSNPVRNLATSFASVTCNSINPSEVLKNLDNIESQLLENSYGILEWYKAFREQRSEKRNLLVIVDQFEELFRYKRESSDTDKVDKVSVSNHFVSLLLKAAAHPEGNVYVVITMRSEFLGDCVQFRDLPEFINEGQYLIPRLESTELTEVIEGPMRLIEAKIARVLVNRLVNDVGDNMDQLPILQHALMRTYDKWKNDGGEGEIAHKHYEFIGEMDKALAQHADELYKNLKKGKSGKSSGDKHEPSKNQRIAEIIFKCLTDRSSDDRGIRRPCKLGAIYSIAGQVGATHADVNQVIDHFRSEVSSFLMPPITVPLTPELVLDISHESIMRNWQLLNDWIDEEVVAGKLYKSLNERRELKEQGKSDWIEGGLLYDMIKWRDNYVFNSTWASRYHPPKIKHSEDHDDLFKKNLEFLKKSEDEDILAVEKEAKRKVEEAERTQRDKRKALRYSLALIVIVILTASTIGSFLLYMKSERISMENRMFQLEKVLSEKEWYTSLDPDIKTRVKETLLVTKGKDSVQLISVFERAHDATNQASFSVGYYLFTQLLDSTNNFVVERRWKNFLKNKVRFEHKFKAKKGVRVLRFIENDSKFIAGAGDGFYQYDIKHPHSSWESIQHFDPSENPIAISSDGKILITYHYDYDDIILYNRKNKTIEREHQKGNLSSMPMAYFTPDNSKFAFVGDNRLKIYDLHLEVVSDEPVPQATVITGVFFYPDGKKYLLTTQNGDVLVKSIERSSNLTAQNRPNNDAKAIEYVITKSTTHLKSVAPIERFEMAVNGTQLTVNAQNGLQVWRDTLMITGFGWQKSISATAFSSDGKWILSAGDSMIYYWKVDSEPVPEEMLKMDVDSTAIKKYLFDIASNYWAEGNNKLAIERFEEALKYDDEDVTLWQWVVYSYYQEKNYDKTMVNALKALSIFPKDVFFYDYLGAVHEFHKNYPEAISSYKKAIKIEPYNYPLQLWLGNAYRENNEFDSALSVLKPLVVRDPYYYEAWNQLGLVYRDMKNFEKAIQTYKKVLSISPEYVDGLVNIGSVYYQMGDVKTAIRNLETALELYPENALVLDDLGFYLIQDGQYEMALSKLDEALHVDSLRFTALAHRGFVYLKKNDLKNAYADLERSQKRSPDYDNVYFYLACYYALKGNKSESIQYLKTAIEKGFEYPHWITKEPSLDAIRKEPEFITLTQRFKK